MTSLMTGPEPVACTKWGGEGEAAQAHATRNLAWHLEVKRCRDPDSALAD